MRQDYGTRAGREMMKLSFFVVLEPATAVSIYQRVVLFLTTSGLRSMREHETAVHQCGQYVHSRQGVVCQRQQERMFSVKSCTPAAQSQEREEREREREAEGEPLSV